MKMDDKYSYFVGIREPVQVRRSLLECTKEVIHHLQKYEQVKQPRVEKLKRILELKHIFEDIDKLNADLKAEFPKADLKFSPAEKIPIKEKKEFDDRNPKPVKVGRREANELEKLEAELNMIENRLNKLSD